MFDKLCAKSWVLLGLVATLLVVGQADAAPRQLVKTRTVTKQRGNKEVTKTKTVVKGKQQAAAQVNVNVNTGNAATVVRTGHVNNSFVALSHNGFAVANHHNAVFLGHGYHNNFAVGHGYGYNFNLVQPVTFAIATPLTVTTQLPVDIVNAPAVPVTETKTVATVQATPTYGACGTVATVSVPTYTYATQKVVGAQVITKVAVPVQVQAGY